MNTSYASATSPEVRRRLHRETDYADRRKRHLKRLELNPGSDTRASLVAKVKERVGADEKASDFLFSLFLTSYSARSWSEICEPFPDDFISAEHEKDFETVELYSKALPEISHFSRNSELSENLPLPALKILAWAINPESFDGLSVRQVPLAEYKADVKRFGVRQNSVSDPQLIFKVDYSDDHRYIKNFEKMALDHGSIMGFHGSPFENFHSILRNGLDASYGKETSLFGDGIYLSEDQEVAFSFLKPGKNALTRSILGEKIGCLVCGEVVKALLHPKYVRTSETKVTGLTSQEKLPKGYIVVEDNECVLVRYILVFNDFVVQAPRRMNFCLVLAVVYTLVIVMLWFMRSSTFRNFYNRYTSEF